MSDYISEDSLVQVLKWLPVKPLLRFRCVCRWWKDIIDSQPFIQEHLALQKPRFMAEYEDPEFLVVDFHTVPSTETLPYPFEVDPERRLRLVNTLHGVVLLYNEVAKNLVLWNPTIRKFSTLSLPEIMQFDWHDQSGLIVEAHSSFWIDPSNNSFKIIVFKLYAGSVNIDGVIYSSIERSWRVLPLDDARSYRPYFQNGPHLMIMIAGVAYWRGRSKCVRTTDQGQRYLATVLVSFNFVQERFGIIEAPQLLHMKYTGLYHPLHCNLRGTLSLVYWDRDDPFRCDIYSRREGEWVNMFRFKVVPPFIKLLWLVEEIDGRCRIVAETGDEVVNLVAYDSGDGCIINLMRELMYNGEIHMAFDFVESLVFPSP